MRPARPARSSCSRRSRGNRGQRAAVLLHSCPTLRPTATPYSTQATRANSGRRHKVDLGRPRSASPAPRPATVEQPPAFKPAPGTRSTRAAEMRRRSIAARHVERQPDQDVEGRPAARNGADNNSMGRIHAERRRRCGAGGGGSGRGPRADREMRRRPSPPRGADTVAPARQRQHDPGHPRPLTVELAARAHLDQEHPLQPRPGWPPNSTPRPASRWTPVNGYLIAQGECRERPIRLVDIVPSERMRARKARPSARLMLRRSTP